MSSNVKHTDYVIQDGNECEYKLTMPEDERIWLKLKGADIGILYNDDGVSIDVYKHGAEGGGPLDTMWLLWSDYEDKGDE